MSNYVNIMRKRLSSLKKQINKERRILNMMKEESALKDTLNRLKCETGRDVLISDPPKHGE